MIKLTDKYTKEELKKGVRNPFYHDFCKDVTIGVRNEDYELFEKIARFYEITVEQVIKSAVYRYAKVMREDFEQDFAIDLKILKEQEKIKHERK